MEALGAMGYSWPVSRNRFLKSSRLDRGFNDAQPKTAGPILFGRHGFHSNNPEI
jgi:hypothetical protein